jgi:hypothetical protein
VGGEGLPRRELIAQAVPRGGADIGHGFDKMSHEHITGQRSCDQSDWTGNRARVDAGSDSNDGPGNGSGGSRCCADGSAHLTPVVLSHDFG